MFLEASLITLSVALHEDKRRYVEEDGHSWRVRHRKQRIILRFTCCHINGHIMVSFTDDFHSHACLAQQGVTSYARLFRRVAFDNCLR